MRKREKFEKLSNLLFYLKAPKIAKKMCTIFPPKKHTTFLTPQTIFIAFLCLNFFQISNFAIFFFDFYSFFLHFSLKSSFFRPVNFSFFSSYFLVRNFSSLNSSFFRFSRENDMPTSYLLSLFENFE